MATLSKHGQEVGRYSSIRCEKRIFANGDILANHGFGWKEWGHVKPGVDPKVIAPRVQAKLEQNIKQHPVWAQYRQAIMEIPISKRWKMISAIEIMPDDPDGVWSEVCDGYGDNIHMSLDEVVNLLRLRKAAEIELKDQKEMEK